MLVCNEHVCELVSEEDRTTKYLETLKDVLLQWYPSLKHFTLEDPVVLIQVTRIKSSYVPPKRTREDVEAAELLMALKKEEPPSKKPRTQDQMVDLDVSALDEVVSSDVVIKTKSEIVYPSYETYISDIRTVAIKVIPKNEEIKNGVLMIDVECHLQKKGWVHLYSYHKQELESKLEADILFNFRVIKEEMQRYGHSQRSDIRFRVTFMTPSVMIFKYSSTFQIICARTLYNYTYYNFTKKPTMTVSIKPGSIARNSSAEVVLGVSTMKQHQHYHPFANSLFVHVAEHVIPVQWIRQSKPEERQTDGVTYLIGFEMPAIPTPRVVKIKLYIRNSWNNNEAAVPGEQTLEIV